MALALPRVRLNAAEEFVSKRPPVAERKFASKAVEAKIAEVKAKVGDPELAWMFENCYPNTLDTTVNMSEVAGRLDTFVITGDIDAMWLRDSACQVWPYLALAKDDPDLRRMYQGLIGRQARSILIDPYANAFLPDPASKKALSWAVDDLTDMKPGVAERKWEVDSLCYCIRLSYGYWKATGDTTPFDGEWASAMRLSVSTFRQQQRKKGPGPYHFQRKTEVPTDTLMLGGFGNPALPVGMIYSMFRPSDDACTYSFYLPSNLFAAMALRQLAEMMQILKHDPPTTVTCRAIAGEVEEAAQKYARMKDASGEEFWAFEVDGYGNQLFMDDANIPGLLGLPYLGCCKRDDAIYQNTRKRALSEKNPYFFKGTAAAGIGGPHEGLNMIWPMALIVQALTSDDDAEIRQCLQWLKTTHAGTGFMHESFDKDNPAKFTRAWFAWANSLFGELIVKLSEERPALLKSA
ncbi:MAG TPA: glycoside hydrolase family 125 protein [Candidatus Saccharimonadales bacterium]|nr:glycoside hydrolase family 125 protein [Candidatus Saccharimonadales bacterium]